MTTRRGFLIGVGAVTAVASLPATAKGVLVPPPPKLEVYDLSDTLVLSDLRECWQYSIDCDGQYVRWDCRWLTNGKGRWCQYHVDVMLDFDANYEVLTHLRETALSHLQWKFRRQRRIRSNLLPRYTNEFVRAQRPAWLKAIEP